MREHGGGGAVITAVTLKRDSPSLRPPEMTRRFLLAALAAFALAACSPQEAADPLAPQKALTIVSADGVSHPFTVELARTPAELEMGLMNRTHLDADAGMLFDLGSPEREASFWMKNTLLPLDMLFIRADGTIRRIQANAVPLALTPILSGGSVRAVLELNGGRAAALGIKAGDKVHHPLFGD